VFLIGMVRGLWWMNQELLELGWGTQNRSGVVAVLGTPCTMPPRNSNCKHVRFLWSGLFE
jgi:hypothetical protein